jgi:negative regulator of sigma E activity
VKLLKQGPKKEWGCLPRVAVAAAVVLLATWLVVS